jgi:protein deglycase
MKAAVLFAEGYEEIEAVTPVDVLRRAGVEVLVAGLGDKNIRGARGIVTQTDCLVSELNADELDLLVLPGGLPGAHNLRDSPLVIELIKKVHFHGKIVAAICAAPVALEKAGVLKDRHVTSYPSKESELTSCKKYTGSRVEIDGNIITGRGPGCSLEFSFALCEALGLSQQVSELKKAMIV